MARKEKENMIKRQQDMIVKIEALQKDNKDLEALVNKLSQENEET
jgi:hypothetical protein